MNIRIDLSGILLTFWLGAAVVYVVRNWWWNRQRRRRVVANVAAGRAPFDDGDSDGSEPLPDAIRGRIAPPVVRVVTLAELSTYAARYAQVQAAWLDKDGTPRFLVYDVDKQEQPRGSLYAVPGPRT